MKFKIKNTKNVTVIQLQGEMVGGPDAVLLSEKLHEFVASNQKYIAMDMNEVRWMNSSGLGILIGSLNTMRNSGGDLKLFGLTDKPRHLLKITQLDKVFDICESEEEAIGKFI